MRKRIPSTPSPPSSGRIKTAGVKVEKKTVWKSEISLFLESADPRLLDKETYKFFCRIGETGARILGPIPLPVQWPEGSQREAVGIHRRLFRILSPTEKTVSLLEKLSLSGSVNASIHVEDSDG